MKQFFSLTCGAALVLLLPTLAHAQGVGIGTTAPDASAALDIVSSSKGVLLPRVANATTLGTPATGLIVYQTGSPAGYYYNAGTPIAPIWQQLLTAGSSAFIQNGTTQQASSNFNISGGGTVGGTLTAGNAKVTSLTTAGLVTTDANGNLGRQAQPTLGLSGQTLTLTSGSGSSNVTLPSTYALSGSFANPGSTTPYFVSPALASASINVSTATPAPYTSNTASTAPYVYGVRAPKAGTVQIFLKAVTIPFNGANPSEQLTIQLYVNGVAVNLSATVTTSPANYGTVSTNTTTGVVVNAGDILSLRVAESTDVPYLQVFTTLLIQ